MGASEIHVSKYGHDTESCGPYLRPCLTIKHAVMNIGSSVNMVYIHGGRKGKEAFYEEQDVTLSKSLYFIGILGDPIIYCNSCGTMFHVRSAGWISFENVRFSNGVDTILPLGKRGTTAFKVHNTTLNLHRCHFENIPYGVYFESEAKHRLTFSNNTFNNQCIAIDIRKIGYLYLRIKNCEFVGPRFASGQALLFEQDTRERSGKLHVEIDNCIFHSLQHSAFMDLTKVAVAKVDIDASQFLNNDMTHPTETWRNTMKSAGVAVLNHISVPLTTRSDITIRNSKFANNTSLNGGSLSFECGKGMNILVENCTFTNNAAVMSGGAIGTSDYCDFTMSSSALVNNSCQNNLKHGKELYPSFDPSGIGGALKLYSYEYSPFDPFRLHPQALLSDCVFKSNWAEYSGSAVYTNTHILTIIRTVMESRYDNSMLRYTASDLLRCKFRCILKNATLIVGSAVDGKTAATFGESTSALDIDSASKFVCPAGSLLSHKELSVSWGHNTKKPAERAFIMFAFSCLKCPIDYYSLKASVLLNLTLNGQSCHKCPPGGICQSGAIRPKSNFWGFKDRDAEVIRFIQLPQGYGCDGRQCRTFDSCASGRTGTLCSTCKNGFTESMLSSTCILNDDCHFVTFWVLAALLFFVYLVFFVLKKDIATLLTVQQFRKCLAKEREIERSCADDTVIDEDDSVGDSSMAMGDAPELVGSNKDRVQVSSVSTAVIKISFYFYQIESLLITFQHKAGNGTASSIKGSFSSFFNFDFLHSHIASTCGIYDATPVNKMIIRVGFVASLLFVLAVLFIFAAIFAKKKTTALPEVFVQARQLSLRNKILVALFEVFLLNYAMFANVIFKLLKCISINGDLFLYMQGDIRCYHSWQYVLIVLIFLWVLPYCAFVFVLPGLVLHKGINKKGFLLGCLLPLPFLLYIFGANVKERMGEGDLGDPAIFEIFTNRTGPFSSAVNKRLYFSWEGVYILRRLLIVVLFTFIAEPTYKFYALLMMQFAFLLHHLHTKPYTSQSMNYLETASLSTLVLITSMNLFSVYGYSHGIEEQGKKLLLLKSFFWIQTLIGIAVPVVIATVLFILILARLTSFLLRIGQTLVEICRR